MMGKVVNLAEKREEKRMKNLSAYEELELQYKEFFESVDYEKWLNEAREIGVINESK